jgi:hypothetical protein
MRRILFLARRAFGQSDRATHRLPPLRMITYLPEPVSESGIDQSRNVGELSPAPTPRQDKASDDDLELQRICEAIGLDVKDVTGEADGKAAPEVAIPLASRDLSHHDLNRSLRDDDLRNDVSADVLRLIDHVEATHEQKPGLRPRLADVTGDAFELATPPVRSTRANPFKRANRAAQTPIARASDLADVLTSLKFRLLKIRLAPDDMDEAQAEIATAIAQLLSPRPKPQIIALSLNTLVSILETAGPAALTKDIETSLARLRAFLLQLNA